MLDCHGKNLHFGSELMRPFHLAFPVDDVDSAVEFYTEILGCSTGRRKEESCVLNLFGHQIVAHKVAEMPCLATNPVDGEHVPAMHFGIVLEMQQWHDLKEKLLAKKISFVIGPYERYKGQPGAQATMFIKDPSGNHIEFKAFANDSAIFDKRWL